MHFQVGDNVRFINEAQSGWVTKVLKGDIVLVEIEDGLEIEISTSELIKVLSSSNNQELVKSNTGNVKDQKLLSEEELTIGNSNVKKVLSFDIVREANHFDIYLVNGFESDFHVFIFEKINGDYILAKEMKVKSNSISKAFQTSLKDNSGYLVEAVWLNQVGKEKKSPISCPIKIKTSRFFKEDSYKLSELLRKKSISEILYQDKDLLIDADISRLKDFKDLSRTKGPRYSKSNKHQEAMEIDLHIEELTDNHRNLSNGEIVIMQIKAMEDKINQAIKSNCKELVVIHGVGKGVLRIEVRNRITQLGFKYSDASYAKYGYGATLIEF